MYILSLFRYQSNHNERKLVLCAFLCVLTDSSIQKQSYRKKALNWWRCLINRRIFTAGLKVKVRLFTAGPLCSLPSFDGCFSRWENTENWTPADSVKHLFLTGGRNIQNKHNVQQFGRRFALAEWFLCHPPRNQTKHLLKIAVCVQAVADSRVEPVPLQVVMLL